MSMTQCAFCKSTLSAGARFCGRCGTVVAENEQDNERQPPVAFDFGRGFGSAIGSPTEFDLSGSTEPDSLFGSTRGEPIEFLPDLRESFDTEGSTIAGPTDSGVRFLPTLHEPLEPEREIGSTIAAPPDAGAGFLPLVGESLRPAQGGVPSIQGTPQAGGVPSVPGTPLRFDSAATYDSPHHEQQQTFHHEHQHYQPTLHAQSPLHQHHQQQAFHHGQQPPQHYQQLQRQFPQRQIGSATSHQPSGGARASQHAQRGCRPSCLTTAITGTVIIAMLVTVVLFFPGLRNALLSPFAHSQLPAMLNLNGNIVPGGALSIHGSNFTPGGTVSLTLDGQPAIIASADSPVVRQASPATQTGASFLLGAYQATIAPSSGTMIAVKDDGTFDITIKTDPNWPVGSSHTLIATEESSRQSVKLTLTIPQKPALASCSKSTTITTLTLGPVTEGQQQTVTAPFRLCTTGSGIVNWTASWDQQQAAWLQLTSSGKIPAPLMQQLQVSASAAGLKAGTYQATVNFSSSGSNLKVVLQVTLMVRPAQATTCVNSSTQALSFTATQGQGNPTPQTVTLTNCGDPGSWSASTRTDDGAHWLSAGPTAGDLQGQATQGVSITVASTTLGAGTYTGQVTFKLGSSAATVNITLTVQPPAQVSCITASSQALSFTATQGQGDPAPQTTTIGNCGSSGDWSISTGTVDGANWLSVTPTHGTLTANAAQDVSIGVTSADLQLGTYAGRVTFKLRSSTMTVNVFLTVQQMRPQPCLHVNTASLAFTSTQGQGNPDPQMLTLANCGPAGDWSAIIANDSSWLNLNLGKGRLNTGATQDVLVTVSTAHLNQGTYRDRVIFTLGSRSVLVDVILTVQSPPQCIQVSTQSLRFAATQDKPTRRRRR